MNEIAAIFIGIKRLIRNLILLLLLIVIAIISGWIKIDWAEILSDLQGLFDKLFG